MNRSGYSAAIPLLAGTRLVEQRRDGAIEKAQNCNSRGRFFAAAAEAMRRILIERARQKSTRSRGQAHARRELRDADLIADLLGDETLDLDGRDQASIT